MPFDLSFLLDFAELSPLESMVLLFVNGGYLVVIAVFLVMGKILWLKWRQTLYAMKQKFMVLAVDVPADVEQSPKAVEHIFAQLAGIHKRFNLIEKWIDGFFTLPVSFELVSMGGYIQYLIRLPEAHRDFVEAIIYAQYPDAEIYEIEDYATMLPTTWPQEKYDMWGTELILTNKDYFPIKTYPHFEHQFFDVFADPLASLLEFMSKMKQGEYVWFQLVLTPISDEWKEEGEREARKLAGQKVSGASPKGLAKILGVIYSFFTGLFSILPGFGGGAGGEQTDSFSKIFLLTPGERNVIESIQMKVAKVGYKVKARVIYWGEKTVFSKIRIPPMFGALKQFAWLNMNGFRPDPLVMTKANYFMVERRIAKKQCKLALAYIGRSQDKVADRPIILNTEELASLWHFPAPEIRTPLVKRAEGKKSTPPQFLPDEELLSRVISPTSPEALWEAGKEESVPKDLPVG